MAGDDVISVPEPRGPVPGACEPPKWLLGASKNWGKTKRNLQNGGCLGSSLVSLQAPKKGGFPVGFLFGVSAAAKEVAQKEDALRRLRLGNNRELAEVGASGGWEACRPTSSEVLPPLLFV